MANENKKLSKRERTRVLLTRIFCGILAFLMVGGMAYYSIAFLFGA